MKKYTDEEAMQMMLASIPSEEEQREGSKRYYSFTYPTHIENWPSPLKALSIPGESVKLTPGEQVCIIPHNYLQDMDPLDEEGRAAIRKSLVLTIDEVMNFMRQKYWTNRFFVRLGSRSPKDSFVVDELGEMAVKSGEEAVYLLENSMERVPHDLWLDREMEMPSYIHIRPWINIPEWAEFRCFMENKQLVGMSQYFYNKVQPELAQYAEILKQDIENFFHKQFVNVIHLDSCVFDVFVDGTVDKVTNIKLLEINPFWGLSDPCLFRDGNLDGTFRYYKSTLDLFDGKYTAI